MPVCLLPPRYEILCVCVQAVSRPEGVRGQVWAHPLRAALNQIALQQAALNQAALNQAALNQAALEQAALNRVSCISLGTQRNICCGCACEQAEHYRYRPWWVLRYRQWYLLLLSAAVGDSVVVAT
jgi:hypothetical protein